MMYKTLLPLYKVGDDSFNSLNLKILIYPARVKHIKACLVNRLFQFTYYVCSIYLARIKCMLVVRSQPLSQPICKICKN